MATDLHKSWPASTGGSPRTAEATVPMKDDGLYRGDGAFEVIRLYGGRPFALDDHLDRLERSAAAIELEFDRAALEARDRRPARRGRRRRRAAAADRHPRRAADRGIEPTSPPTPRRSARHGHLQPERDPQRGQVALLRGQHAGDPARPGAGRRRGGAGPCPTAPCSSRRPPRSSGSPRRAGCARRRSSSGVLESITRDRLVKALHVEEGAWPVADLRAAQEAFLASTTREIQAVAAIDRSGRWPRRPAPAPARRRRPSRRP